MARWNSLEECVSDFEAKPEEEFFVTNDEFKQLDFDLREAAETSGRRFVPGANLSNNREPFYDIWAKGSI